MSKQEWGNSTWFLFHGLVTKLKPEYNNEYKTILSYFINVCNHLPCPDCKSHAIYNNHKANLKLIINKNYLKDYLWQFHNRVNLRLGKEFFTIEEHNNLYKTVNIRMLIPPFIQAMTGPSSSRLMATSFHRVRFLNNFIKYLYNNLYKILLNSTSLFK